MYNRDSSGWLQTGDSLHEFFQCDLCIILRILEIGVFLIHKGKFQGNGARISALYRKIPLHGQQVLCPDLKHRQVLLSLFVLLSLLQQLPRCLLHFLLSEWCHLSAQSSHIRDFLCTAHSIYFESENAVFFIHQRKHLLVQSSDLSVQCCIIRFICL